MKSFKFIKLNNVFECFINVIIVKFFISISKYVVLVIGWSIGYDGSVEFYFLMVIDVNNFFIRIRIIIIMLIWINFREYLLLWVFGYMDLYVYFGGVFVEGVGDNSWIGLVLCEGLLSI